VKIDKSILSLSGEYYVAAELGKRNIYAQLTLGNQKRTDLLIFSEHGTKLLKIEVKCKQGSSWPNCKGIIQKDSFIVFVDFKDLESNQRPDFYILSKNDWSEFVQTREKEYKSKHPNRRTIIENNVLILLDEVNKKNGKPHKGCSVRPKNISEYKEKWHKIIDVLNEDF